MCGSQHCPAWLLARWQGIYITGPSGRTFAVQVPHWSLDWCVLVPVHQVWYVRAQLMGRTLSKPDSQVWGSLQPGTQPPSPHTHTPFPQVSHLTSPPVRTDTQTQTLWWASDTATSLLPGASCNVINCPHLKEWILTAGVQRCLDVHLKWRSEACVGGRGGGVGGVSLGLHTPGRANR